MTARGGIAVIVLALAAWLAGCGGHTVSKQDVIARANQICDTAASAVRAIAPPTGQSATELARYYQQVTPIVLTEVKQLRALPQPAQDRTVLVSYLDAVGVSERQYEELASAARSGDRTGLVSAAAALRSNPAAGLAARYGITRCGASLGTAAS